MDDRDYDIALLEIQASNEKLEQQWALEILGKRAKVQNGEGPGTSLGEDAGSIGAAQGEAPVDLPY